MFLPIRGGLDREPLSIEMPKSWDEVQVDSIYVLLNESEDAPLELLKKEFPNTAFKAEYGYSIEWSRSFIQRKYREEYKK